MAQPAFRRHSLEGYGRQFVEATSEVLDSWAVNAATGRPLAAAQLAWAGRRSERRLDRDHR
jgi:hypothetical protein